MVERVRQSSVADTLGKAILSGEHAPGEVLLGELAYASALGVSRGAYREGVQALIAKGLVESRRKAGTRVLPRERWNILDPKVLEWAFLGMPDQRLLRSLFELRSVVEPFAARLAADRCSKEDLQRMDAALLEMDRWKLSSALGMEADGQFHKAVLTASQNDAFIALAPGIAAGVEWSTRFKQREHLLDRDPVPEHRKVFDAIAERNPDAAFEAMGTLVRNALEDTWYSLRGPVSAV